MVHHRSPGSIGRTVRSILDGGVAAEGMIIVDNSESAEITSRVRRDLPAGVELAETTNGGYGQAANLGIERFLARPDRPRYLLVSTHEVIPEVGAIARLVAALDSDPGLVAVGPVLRSRNASGGRNWVSYGGYFSSLGLPRHRGSASEPVSRVDWLDGAFVLYRLDALERNRFREEFFLYFEETELQARLVEEGGVLAVVRDSRVDEVAHRVPTGLEGRNLQWFLQLHGNRMQRLLAGPARLTANLLRVGTGRMSRKELGEFRQGLREARRSPLKRRRKFTVINPLGAALDHYADALIGNLGGSGQGIRLVSIPEPSASGGGTGARLKWISGYLKAIRKASSRGGAVLSLWPVLGFWDRIILAVSARRSALVVHDPEPLVRALGYGRLARLAAWAGSRAELLVHSDLALERLKEFRFNQQVRRLPHPFAEPFHPFRDSGSVTGSPRQVRVLGQYKPDRDLDALEEISRAAGPGWELEIIGRRWPAVGGWSVRDEFVTEAEFRRLITTADVVVIPYSRFFQSGVAVRALELSTPFVAPPVDSIVSLVGEESSWLARDSWAGAVRAALDADAGEIQELAAGLKQDADDQWSDWLAGFWI